MTCYKLNIFKDSRETWTESALNPFININPIYFIIHDMQKDEFKSVIFKIISNYIININDPYSINSDCDLDFRIINNTSWGMSEREVVVKSDVNSIVDFLMNNNISIYQKSTGKYWCRYYIEFSETSNKGCEYSIDEIICYIKQMLGCKNLDCENED